MSETLDNTQETTGKRPAFLTVLCILSFIAAGISIIGLILGAVAGGVVEAAAGQIEAEGGTATVETGGLWTLVIVGAVLTAVSLIGVIKMWRLQKQGFYLYTGAAVANIIAGVILGGFSPLSIVFTVAFIVMYGVNLKHMK